jgi:hypothetical protein
MTTKDRQIIADALVEARRLTEELCLLNAPSREQIIIADAKLKRALELVDNPAK